MLELNRKIAGVLLFPVGFSLLWLGGIALTGTLQIYNGYVNPASTLSSGWGVRISLMELETAIIISALTLGASITALVGGFLLLRRSPITRNGAA